MEVKEEIFRIRTYDCGVDGRIKIYSLMQYMQEIAALHAEQLGLGFDKLGEMNGYWVLSNIRIEISRLPGWDDEVTLKTWPSGYTRAIATREFVGKDQNGSELFRAGSEWMVLNKETNRLKNLFKLDLNLPKILRPCSGQAGAKVLPDELKRLQPMNEYNQAGQVLVPHSAIDLNGHVNNTEYVRWGMDVLRRTFKLKGTPFRQTRAKWEPDENIRCVQATYLSEAFEGDELEVLINSGAGGRYGVLGRKTNAETNVFLMEVSCFTAELTPFDSAQGEG